MMIDRSGSDLFRLRRQAVLLRVLLSQSFDFRPAIAKAELVQRCGEDAITTLAKLDAGWKMTILDTVEDATIDGKAVLLPSTSPPWRRLLRRLRVGG